MSAPLVINLKDGSVWERRAVTGEGVALYALAGSCKCPEFVMATESELAALGIVGSADVLPMPVGPQPLVDDDRAKAPWGRDENGRPLLGPCAHWTDVPELVDQELARLRGRVDQAQSGHWYVASDTEAWRSAGTVRTNVDGYQRTVGRVTNMGPADLDLVLHAHDDLSWCLEMVAKFRARVAELEAELLVANGVLDDAAKARRANAAQALPWAAQMDDGDLHDFLGDLVSAAMGRWQSDPEVPDRVVLAAVEKACAAWRTPGEGLRSDPEPDECPCPPAGQPGPHQLGCPEAEVPVAGRSVEESADRLTAFFAPVSSLREVVDGEHWSTVHHDWRLGRDLPETGGGA